MLSMRPSSTSRIFRFSCSNTRYIFTPSLKTSIKLTMWSCFSYFKMRISLKAVFLTY